MERFRIAKPGSLFGASFRQEPDNIFNIEIHGEVDLYTSPLLERGISALFNSHADSFEQETKLLINMKEVSFIDCSTISVLVRVWKKLKELNPCSDIFIICEKEPRRALDCLGAHMFFSIHKDERSAYETIYGPIAEVE